jgi:hypothetical protein
LFDFEMLREEPEAEHEEKKPAEQAPFGEQERISAAKSPQENEHGEIKDCLVQLDGMAGYRVAPVGGMKEQDGPGDCGGGSQDFLVHEIADADAGSRERGRDRDEIEKAQPGKPGLDLTRPTRKQPEGDQNPERAAVAREPPFANPQQLQRIE